MSKIKEKYSKLKDELEKRFPNYKKYVPYVVVGVLTTTLYTISKVQDSVTQVHIHKESVKFEGGRTIGDGRSIYQMKEKVVSKRIETLENSVKLLNETLTKFVEKTSEEKTEELKKNESVPPKGGNEKTPTAAPASVSEEVTFSDSPSSLSVSSVPSYSESPSPRPVSKRKTFVREIPRGPSIISFPVQGKERVQEEMTVKVPSGSYLKAKLLTGVEASESRPVPVLLQADFFFVGPNKSKIDLSGCFIIAKSQGNLSIERVEMQANKISCVSKSGRMFEKELNGFMADGKDSSFGITGLVNSKQDRVASVAFLSSIVQGIGSAIQQAQTNTQANALGGASTIVTGDQAKYMAAGGVSNAASLVTNWYLQHAQNLLPTINIGSGQDVWIVLQDTVDLPNWYFAKAKTQAVGSFSYLSRLNE
ncbi:MAG: TraB/VirB10 family protein [Bacteriovoracaceae bacterium]